MASDSESSRAEDVGTLELELELEKLERQWLEEKHPYLAYENVNVPLSYFLGFFMFAVPIVIIGWGLLKYEEVQNSDKGAGMVVGVIVLAAFLLVGSVVVWMYHSRKDQLYKEAKQRYEDRREQLLQDIAASREKARAGERTA